MGVGDRSGIAMSAPAGSAPATRDRLGLYGRWAWRWFGPRGDPEPEVGAAAEDLERAHWRLTPIEFRSLVRASAVLVGGVTFAVVALIEALGGMPGGPGTALAVLAVAPLSLGAAAWALGRELPRSRAVARGQRIDREFAPALAFVAALSLTDPNLDTIVRELAASDLYPEISEEASWVVRDIDLLGLDAPRAVREAARRTPSALWREFLQGIVTTSEGGGDLRAYLLAQADRTERDGAVRTQARLDRLGTYAESYVTVAVAFPLFLLVLLSVFALLEGASGGILTLVWITALGIIPAAEIAFGALFWRWRDSA